MEVVARAQARYIRVSPRKMRLVIDLIRGENVSRAMSILASINKRPKKYVQKALKSAMSNARQNPDIKVNELFISRITADGGPTLKRFRAAAMGRATMIRHRMAHLTVELARAKQLRPQVKKKKLSKRGKVKK